MSEQLTVQEWHKKQAIENFNGTWDLIDKTDRSEEEAIQMIHKAHASRFHWGEVGGPKQLATGEWQISRVYALVGQAQSALLHGQAGLRFCEEGSLTPFDYGFAYEAIARAYHMLGDTEQRDQFILKGKDVAAKIESEDDRSYYVSELESILK